MNLNSIFLNWRENVRKVCKNLDLSPIQYFAVYIYKVSAWQPNHEVCKIGLNALCTYANSA